jgi:hypothetical protein
MTVTLNFLCLGPALFWRELGRLRQHLGYCDERILPEPGLDILHIVPLGQSPLYRRRAAALEWKLIGHEKCPGSHHEQPDEPVCSDIGNRFL